MTMVSENVIGWQRDLPPINWRPLSWPRIEFKSPGPDGVVYGFLFRLVGAAVAVLVGSLLVVVTGAFNGWSLTPRLLCIEAGLVGILVLLTEHLRSRVYERLIAGDETKVLAIADIRPLPETPSLPLRPRHSSLQRFTDVVFAAALLVFLAPAMLLIAVLVKLDSQGPILARLTLVSKGGRQFRQFTFRTMSWETGGQDIDPRATRVGRFLRQFSLNELPALLNVLWGDLSVVGPRPMRPQEMARLDAQLANRRAALRPGLIGAWSVGDKGAEGLLAELQFHERASIWDEMRLVGRTVLAVLSGAGAV